MHFNPLKTGIGAEVQGVNFGAYQPNDVAHDD